ncbi:hypothetical protein J6590_016013, partial [Homalodisca vitripennis]
PVPVVHGYRIDLFSSSDLHDGQLCPSETQTTINRQFHYADAVVRFIGSLCGFQVT